MEGKLIKFSSKEEKMWTAKLDDRDMEILKDMLESRYVDLGDILRGCVMDDDTRSRYKEERIRIRRLWDLINKED